MAATHWGNCQICGKQHKVTGTSIAKHGYTVQEGWQSGACWGGGPGAKPIQLSCDLIEGALEYARKFIVTSSAEITRLEVSPLDDDGKVWAAWLDKNQTGERAKRAGLVTIALNDKHQVALYERSGSQVYAFHTSVVKTVEDGAGNLADARIRQLRQWIAQSLANIDFMTEQLANWKPTDLIPISAADQAAVARKVHFKAARYGYKDTTMCSGSAMAARRNSGSALTDDRELVTCAACKKSLVELNERPAKLAAAKEAERLRQIKGLERNIKNAEKSLKGETDDTYRMNISRSIILYAAELDQLRSEAPSE